MSAKVLAACSFEPVVKHIVPGDRQPPEGLASEMHFPEDLWREYRREAIAAGFSTSEATEYASALSPEIGLVAGGAEMTPLGPGWFYQSRIRVVMRTVTSGLIGLTRWGNGKTSRRTATSGIPIFCPKFRPWNPEGKN